MSVRVTPPMTWQPRTPAPGPFPRFVPSAPEAVIPAPSIVTTVVRASELKWPFEFVMLYFLVDFARPQDWLSPLAALRPGIFVLGGGIIALILRRNSVELGTRAWLLFAFLALMAMGTPFATNRYWAFIQTKDLALFIAGAVLPLMNFVDTNERMRKLINFLVLIHIPLSLYCLTHGGFGIGAFLGDENDFCLALNVVMPYTFFSLFVARRKAHRVFLLATIGLLLFTITATMSRGGFVGLVAIALACWFASPRKLASLVGIAVLATTVLSFVPATYWDEMKTIETATDEGDTGAQRMYLWGIAWEMFKDHPIVGVGPTNFQWNSFAYESGDQTARGLHVWGKGSHSLYFTLLPEMGLAGVALFGAILAVGLRENRRIRRTYRELVARKAPTELLERLYPLTVYARANDVAVIAYLVTGAFLSVLYYPYFWLQAGFGVAIVKLFDRNLSAQSASDVSGQLTSTSWTAKPRATASLSA